MIPKPAARAVAWAIWGNPVAKYYILPSTEK